LDDVENDLKQIGVTGWRKMAWVRGAWEFVLKEARVLHGQTRGEESVGRGVQIRFVVSRNRKRQAITFFDDTSTHNIC
jgi:hypothetical protein